ncbi:MAG: rhamnulokinase [Actinobacteria bacterium]|nr:rhamnulokinase [Actinomycetota bacterium]
MPAFAAVDLGATSGRVTRGEIVDGRFVLNEVHRFSHEPLDAGAGGLLWQWDEIVNQVKIGLKKAMDLGPLDSAGIDSWAVDYGFLTSDDQLIGSVHCYRDSRTDGVLESVTAQVGRERIYSTTGIQFLFFNTIYQLVSAIGTPEYVSAAKFLLLPDLLNNYLVGSATSEITNASTTQLLDATSRQWDFDLIEELNLRTDIFPELHEAGELLGKVSGNGAIDGLPIVAVASHDTASAVAGIPLRLDGKSAYISSGTWSLIGVEVDSPITTELALAENVTNELGFGGTVRLLKNVTGFWLLEECRRNWRLNGNEYSPELLIELSNQIEIGKFLIDPDDPRFAAPGEMPERIASYCKEKKLTVPESPGEFARCIYDSLALAYAKTIRKISLVSGKEIETIHVVGGGSANDLLNQLTADATGCEVLAGPVEATVMGNLAVQAIAVGAVSDLVQARELIGRSTSLKRFEPVAGIDWESMQNRLKLNN